MCSCRGGCSCTSNSTALPIGNTGPTGPAGSQGPYGGFSSNWSFSTSTSSGTSSTQLRINNSVYSSSSIIYVSNTNFSSNDLTAFLLSLENNTEFGYIRLFKESDSNVFFYAKINSLVSYGSEVGLGITYIESNGTFANGSSVVLTFSPSGAGSSFTLYNNTTPVSTTNGAINSLMSFTLPANKMKTDGDVIEIDAVFNASGSFDGKKLSFKIGGSNFITKIPAAALVLAGGDKYVKVKIRLTRTSVTSLYITVEMIKTNPIYIISAGNMGYLFDETMFGVSDLSTNTLLIECFGQNTSWPSSYSETIAQNQLLVRYFNK
jgi:hypothetical protein